MSVGDFPMTSDAFETIETFRGVVYPWHCDAVGHMNTQFYAGLYDGATLHFLASLCPSPMLRAAALGWADVRQLIEYKREAIAGDLLVVRTTLMRLGTKSIEYHHALVNAETRVLHATSAQVTVLFDLTRRRAVQLTDTIRVRAMSLKSGSAAAMPSVL
jgi:acyl-CoA thioester hydrolase